VVEYGRSYQIPEGIAFYFLRLILYNHQRFFRARNYENRQYEMPGETEPNGIVRSGFFWISNGDGHLTFSESKSVFLGTISKDISIPERIPVGIRPGPIEYTLRSRYRVFLLLLHGISQEISCHFTE
jgi:hypothetical protein